MSSKTVPGVKREAKSSLLGGSGETFSRKIYGRGPLQETYYLLCFSYILVVPETFKNWFLPSQFPLQLLSPPFGHQGILKKRLGCHLQAINAKKCRKWSPKRAPMLGPFLDILPLCAVPGALGSQNGSQGSPKSPQDHSKPRFSAILNRFLIDSLMNFRVTWATFC